MEKIIKNALLIGNSYVPPGMESTVNTHKDARSIRDLLKLNGDETPNFPTRLLLVDEEGNTSVEDTDENKTTTTSDVTWDEVMEQFFFPAHSPEYPPAVGVFYLASRLDLNFDSDYFIPISTVNSQSGPGISLPQLVEMANRSPYEELVLILDAGFAGGAGYLNGEEGAPLELRHGLSILTATMADQEASASRRFGGIFTNHLIAGLKGEAANQYGYINLIDLFNYIQHQTFSAHTRSGADILPSQTPQLKTNGTRYSPIRSNMSTN